MTCVSRIKAMHPGAAPRLSYALLTYRLLCKMRLALEKNMLCSIVFLTIVNLNHNLPSQHFKWEIIIAIVPRLQATWGRSFRQASRHTHLALRPGEATREKVAHCCMPRCHAKLVCVCVNIVLIRYCLYGSFLIDKWPINPLH